MKYYLPVLWFIAMVSGIHCFNQMEKRSIKTPIDIQGHRGCRGYMPENSIQGFIRAVELGVTTLEMDVVVSADKQIVVSHEPWISTEICKTPEVVPADSVPYRYNIYQMPYNEVKQFDCGSKIHPGFPDQNKLATSKPLLHQVFQVVDRYTSNKKLEPVRYNIEIKFNPRGVDIFHPGASEFARLLVTKLKNEGVLDRAIVQCFDLGCLQEIKKLEPSLNIALLVDEDENYVEKLNRLGFAPDILSPEHKLVDQEMIVFCEQNSLQVIPWTVNSSQEMKRLLYLGVDGIISDYPDRVLATMGHISN